MKDWRRRWEEWEGAIHVQTSECKRSSAFLYSRPALLSPLVFLSLSLSRYELPLRLNGCPIRAVITLIWRRAISTLCPSLSLPSPFNKLLIVLQVQRSDSLRHTHTHRKHTITVREDDRACAGNLKKWRKGHSTALVFNWWEKEPITVIKHSLQLW